MGRIINAEKVAQIKAARLSNPELLGPALGELVIESNVPVVAVAELLHVAEPTIYRWMYGESEPRDADKVLKLKRLLALLRKARKGKEFPLLGTTEARVELVVQLIEKYKPAPRPA
jgi:hypothetical protein